METVYDVLYYLNKLDFTDKVNNDDLENLRCAKRVLVKEFEDYIISKLIDVLSVVDNLLITFTVGERQDILNKTDTLRENILYLISYKHFVKIIVNLIDHFGFKFNHININYYLKLRIPIMLRQFFRKSSQNRD